MLSRARDWGASLGLKRASEGATPQRAPSEDALPSASAHRPHSMDLTFRNDADDSLEDGLLNPLAWDNLPSALRDRLEQPSKNDKEEKPSSKPGKENKKKLRNIVAQPKGSLEYTVEVRDTLASIAAKFDTTTSEMKKLNKLMTQMVFTGQVIYVPDKNYVASSPSTPSPCADQTGADVSTSPLKSEGSMGEVPEAKSDSNKSPFPDVAMLRMRMPGHAERLKTDSSDSAPVRTLSEEEARRLDEECFERFIKVSVKHITDGQGVVSGVLLVTPNAIMFDPNVSDPLVVEHGTDKYGMIAPMDTIISAAMYHDIAAMNFSRKKKSEDDEEEEELPKPEVYHDKNCPLYPGHTQKDAAAAAAETVDVVTEDKGDVHEAVIGRVCSCSSFQLAAKECQLPVHSTPATAPLDMASNNRQTSNQDLKTVTECEPVSSIKGISPSLLVDVSANNSDDVFVTNSTPQPACQESVASLPEQTRQSMDSSDSKDNPQRVGSLSELGQPALSTALSSSPNSVICTSAAPTNLSTSSAQSGILSRTIGSISSMGSFAGLQLVDFSSGLFTRNQEDQGKVKDIRDGESLSPPKRLFFLGTDLSEERDGSVARKSERVHSDSALDSDKGKDPVRQSSIDLEVENVVKLNDKPELFRAFDALELVPRPATLYEDPPLYLCLKVGNPLNKRVSKTCPIEAYLKNRQKPEYWFSIPLERVDQLYAFFIQWSPNIYGAEQDIDAKEWGFVVLDDSEDENGEKAEEDADSSLEVFDNHFPSSDGNPKLLRQMTKDWEVVNVKEVRRRISAAEVENLPLPELLSPSTLIDDSLVRKLCFHLPARAEGYPWSLIYSSEKHGFSLKTLYRTMLNIDSPILLVIRDTNNHVFGALLSCALKMSDHFYGTGESFLFTFSPEFRKYPWTGNNNFFMKGNAESLSVGAGEGSFGLWMDGDLYHGRTQHCQTFDNDLLTGDQEDFVLSGVEAWGFL